jgi:hypothetical protein
VGKARHGRRDGVCEVDIGQRKSGMTAFAGGFNRSMQHIRNCLGRRSVADDVQIKNLLYGEPEGPDEGALEEGQVAPTDGPAV